MGLLSTSQITEAIKSSLFFNQKKDAFKRFFNFSPSAPADPSLNLEPNFHVAQDNPEQTKASLKSGQPLLDVDEVFRLFRQCIAALDDICKAKESDFLNLGAQLQTIYSESEALTQSAVNTLAADQDLTIQGTLENIKSDAADALKELSFKHSKLNDDLDGLGDIQKRLKPLNGQNSNFKKVAKNLKMVGFNISIESVRTSETKAAYHVLAEEITHLADAVSQVASDVKDDTDSVINHLKAIHSETASRMVYLSNLIDEADTAVKDALNEVEKLTQLSIRMLDNIAVKSKEISDQVGQLVLGIQIHDNISQRAAHIISSLNEAMDYIESSNSETMLEKEVNAAYGRAYSINRLQMSQLKTISTDIDGVGKQNAEALEKLLTAVQNIASGKDSDFSENELIDHFDTHNIHHPINILGRALEKLIALFDEGHEDINRLNQARRQAGSTIAGMVAHIDKVRDINFDIHLKALNAVVKSTRLGETGRAIEAIVFEMKALAEQSNSTIEAVATVMEDVANSSKTIDDSSELEKDGHTNVSGEKLRQGIDLFLSACASFGEQSQNTLNLGGDLQAKISAARQQLHFFDEMVNVFNEQLEILTRVDHLFQPFADSVGSDWLEQERSILERYTMDRERDAHRMAQQEHDVFADSEQNAADDDDNIEFF